MKAKILIDHIGSNISTKLIHCNVIVTDEISEISIYWTLNNYQLALSMHLMTLMIELQFLTN